MKMRYLLFGLVCGLLAFSGCSKKAPPGPAPMDISGVKVDVPKLQAAFASAPTDQQGLVNDASSNLRYGLYDRSLQALDKLANTPGLTDAQKQVVTDVTEQLKQVVAKAGPTRQ